MELFKGASQFVKAMSVASHLERQEVWNDCKSCKVIVGSNGNLLWEASVLLGRKKDDILNRPENLREGYESHVKMIVKSLKEEKMYVKFSNNVEAEQRGSYLDVEGIKWVKSRSWLCRKEQTIS
ncbi:hypothetical protein Tco_1507094 [Tanacetum coccineum]